jgi:hypothetical protein
MFQIEQCLLDANGQVVVRHALQPSYELWEDAAAMAEFDSLHLDGDYGFDAEQNCWWAFDLNNRMYRFEIREVADEFLFATPEAR